MNHDAEIQPDSPQHMNQNNTISALVLAVRAVDWLCLGCVAGEEWGHSSIISVSMLLQN